jgi:PAS domain S-box-containing protein
MNAQFFTAGGPRDYPSWVTRVPMQGRAPTHAEVLDQIDVAVISTDAVGFVTTWNTRASALYGWSAEEAVGRSLVELLAPQGKEDGAREIVSTVRTGVPWQGTVRLRCRDGSFVTTFVRNSPLLDGGSDFVGAVSVSIELGDPELASAVQAATALGSDGRRTRLLSPREREILGLLARGLTGEQIAERLVLSPETVRTHIRNAREKLGASTRVEAVTMALIAREIDVA